MNKLYNLYKIFENYCLHFNELKLIKKKIIDAISNY